MELVDKSENGPTIIKLKPIDVSQLMEPTFPFEDEPEIDFG
jgi:hypothetical protein